jgi:hypothetical protein
MEAMIVYEPKLAEHIGSLKEGRDFLQLPVVSASAMGSFATKQPGAQKLRRELTRTLHWQGEFCIAWTISDHAGNWFEPIRPQPHECSARAIPERLRIHHDAEDHQLVIEVKPALRGYLTCEF